MKGSVDQRTQIPSERSCYVGGVFCVSNDVTAFFFCSEKFAVISQKHDTVGKNEKVIREYIQTQLQEDKLYDQMSMK